MSRQNLVVFDIDGVLLNSEHRIDLWISGAHDQYFAQVYHDEPIPQGIAVCQMFVNNPEYRVIFVTGRGDTLVHRSATLSRLKRHISADIKNAQLLMREYPEVGPHVHDTVKKPLMIEAAGYSLDDIFMVFEDRNSIVEMWRSRGIVCYQTQVGDF